jgi:serine/threonine-protein kinase
VKLLLELVDGKTLDQMPSMPLGKLLPILAQVAGGLVNMHRREVSHGDVQPKNIIFGKRFEVKVLDYTAARIKGETTDVPQGTFEYVAPETLRANIINEQTDIFNFGATIYRLTTLKFPASCAAVAEGATMDEGTWKARFIPARKANPRVPQALCDLITHCMAFNPLNRPSNMFDVYQVLKYLAADAGEMIEGGTDAGV